VYGYDIGIARAWRSTNYSYAPAAWMRLESAQSIARWSRALWLRATLSGHTAMLV